MQHKLLTSLRVDQRLAMTQAMRTALEVLQMPIDTLEDYIEDQIDINPLLKRTSTHSPIKEITPQSAECPFAPFIQEIKCYFTNALHQDIAFLILDSLDNKGLLTLSVDEIHHMTKADIKTINDILKKTQDLLPPGSAAFSHQDSFLLQLKRKKLQTHLAYTIIQDHYDLLLANKLPLIAKRSCVSIKEVKDAIKNTIATLSLSPLPNDRPVIARTATADIVVTKEHDLWHITINSKSLPAFSINQSYLKSANVKDKPVIKQYMTEGKWLTRMIRQRQKTLLQITKELLKVHDAFLAGETNEQEPLTMSALAETLEMHESTITRAVNGKYIDTPIGLIALRSLFSSSLQTKSGNISSQSVKTLILAYVTAENKQSPLSDQALSVRLKEQGITCARRTVAKYRLLLKLPNASQRKTY